MSVMSTEEQILGGGTSKRRQGPVNYLDRADKRSRKQKHLYLVVDDWSKGFSIRKIDIDAMDSSSSNLDLEPLAVRLVSPEPRDHTSFAALGSNIFMASNGHPATMVYDTETAGLAIGPPLPEPLLLRGTKILFATADMQRLYVFKYNLMRTQQAFEVMSAKQQHGDLHSSNPSTDWSWTSVGSPLPLTEGEEITAYAMHPDGRTVFMSSRNGRDDVGSTFSFDDTRTHGWRFNGRWPLPFRGQGYFDTELDAWVGLREDRYVCACQIPSRGRAVVLPPGWQVVKEKLFLNHSGSQGATLTYMGDSRFCLVERVLPEEDEEEVEFDADCSMIYVTVFGLKYSREGELRTTVRRTTKSYQLSTNYSRSMSFPPVAFWL